jgi:hypothetical protein
MVGPGIRSPIGLVVGSCTSHPGVLGSIPKREEPGKTGAPCVKVPGSSRARVPGFLTGPRTHPYRPRLVVSHSACRPLSSSPHREQLCNRSCSNKHTHTEAFLMRSETFLKWVRAENTVCTTSMYLMSRPSGILSSSSMYAALNSNSDPDVIIKLDISKRFQHAVPPANP